MKLAINVGNLLELTGAVILVLGILKLAGEGWALIGTAVLVLIAAEINYSDHVWRFPLPLKPQPKRWVTERRQALEVRQRRTRRKIERWQARTVRR
jgi:hypothetical protein